MTQRPQRRKREVDVIDGPAPKKPKPLTLPCSVTQEDELQFEDIDVEGDIDVENDDDEEEEEKSQKDPMKTKQEDILRNWVQILSLSFRAFWTSHCFLTGCEFPCYE